ncbi:hypothetical protein XU18_5190 [Perkinsela sp. CCAP 1560/4]|nr:hypothetical protein XU18_5190 [Perkinsela sp. CCAP 1560/4]|eukprot:KNH01401.1 hypothetical protein XU18_5190 [Perkinsela sp. CCAP 1560/4]
MAKVLLSVIHSAYSVSLLVLTLFIAANIFLPLSLQWPTYCMTNCKKDTFLRDYCESYCNVHHKMYGNVETCTGLRITDITKLLDKECHFAHLIWNPPKWFTFLNILLTVSSIVSILFWVATITSNRLARALKNFSRLASVSMLLAFTTYLYGVFFHEIHDVSDLFVRVSKYTVPERIFLGTIFLCPVLQLIITFLVPRNIKRRNVYHKK